MLENPIRRNEKGKVGDRIWRLERAGGEKGEERVREGERKREEREGERGREKEREGERGRENERE